MFSSIFIKKVGSGVSTVAQAPRWLVMDPEALRASILNSVFTKSSCHGSLRYFAAYEVTKTFLTPAGSSPADLHLGAIILAGGTAGVAMWAIAIPPDVRFSSL